MSASREGLAPSRTMSQSHLDDFNEFAQDDDEGVGTAWDDADVAQHDAMDEKMIPSAELLRNNPEELNALILLRMMTLNVLHPALRQGPEGEKTYWRGLVTRVWDILETESPSPLTLGANSGVGQDATMTQNSFQTSKMMKLLIREWIVCRLAWPCMDKICQPDYLNQRIAEKAQKRIMLQKTIRGFRTFLDSHFSNFPPSFVQSNADSAHTPASLTERSRFFEPLSKYSRKVRSGIDAKAIRHQIVSELRRRVDEAKDLQYYEELYGEPVEVLKRYVKSLDVLRAKYEKRISALTGEEMKSSDNTKRSPSANMFLRGDDPTGSKGGLTLRAMFDEYAKSVELGTERSTSLYYFLDYLEKRDDKRGMAKVRFWLAAEKYRKLVWRLMHGIVPSDAHPASNEPVSEHEGEVVGILMRLQKEAARIYHAFLAVQPGQSKPAVDIGNAILLSAIEEFATEAPSDLTRYSTLTELEESQDYKCVLVAQDMVYRELQDDFADFQHSESYFRWTSEEEKKKLTEADDASSGSGTVGGSLSEPYNVVQNRRSVDVMSRKSEEGVLASGNASFSAEFGEGGKGGEGFEVEVVQSTLLKLLLKEVENVAVRITGVKVIKAQSRAATSPTKSWFSRRESDLDSPMTPAFSFTIAAVDGSEVMTPDELSINQFATDTEEIHSARKDSFLDDESEYHAPGELLTTTTKLQQLKEEIDKVLLQIDCINLLNTFVQNERETAERNDKSNGSTNYLATVITHIFDQTKELLRQEVGDLTRQKAKYQSQEVKDAIVPGQCTVKIEAAFDDIVRRKDPTSVEGKKVTFYLIRIDKDLDMSGWTVRRRYSDFHALHRKLSQRFPVVQEFELPGKSLGIWPKGKKDLKYARMKSLEKYLQVGSNQGHVDVIP
ncbi:Intermediate filament protein [Rhizophlyctis rosea]|uniref:Intermediate filament protein n=1 Tax=Rhizophlyctis rosea TaxID=64517 RepID=A0AAD5SJ03_9FUNG|nr:Intermediate filament protein [Rhizophlyctis rosea]